MDPDRKIGRVVKVNLQALVELLPETSSYAKSSYGGVYAIAAVNSYVILPIGSERVVAVVTGLDMMEEQEMRYQSRQTLGSGIFRLDLQNAVSYRHDRSTYRND